MCRATDRTDVQDSQWLRQLHRFGLLNASFRPEDIICRLRSLHRHRDNLVSSSASEIQHMQKALQQMNLHLHHVVSDITGLTGLRIIDAILAGQRDPRAAGQIARQASLQEHAPRDASSPGGRLPWRTSFRFKPKSYKPTASTKRESKNATVKRNRCWKNWPSNIEAASANLKSDALEQSGSKDESNRPEQLPERKPTLAQNRKRKRKPRANRSGAIGTHCGIDLTQVVGLNVLNVLLIV